MALKTLGVIDLCTERGMRVRKGGHVHQPQECQKCRQYPEAHEARVDTNAGGARPRIGEGVVSVSVPVARRHESIPSDQLLALFSRARTYRPAVTKSAASANTGSITAFL